MQIEDFSLVKWIGKGAFGEVYLTTRNGFDKFYATKKIPKRKVENPSIKKQFLDEIKILKELNHKNIIKFITIKQTATDYYIISEYYNGRGLHEVLRQYKVMYGKPFPENIVQHLMRQIIDALIYLHQRKIIHRDLKLDNLLINFKSEEDKINLNLLNAEVKIIDFGFATHLEGSNLSYNTLGSPINMDPILLTKINNPNISYLIGYNEKADIWSLGTVCYEMATGELIFNVQNVNQLIQCVDIGIYHVPTFLSQELVSFLDGMLQYFGKDRLTAVELANHPFLTKDVNEFTKIDLTNPNNKFDVFGLILNIKKGNKNGINTYEMLQKLNINPNIHQNYGNQYHQQGYNYYANARPKYYVANLNRKNYDYQYNQRQSMNQYQYQNQFNNSLRYAQTYQPVNNKYQNVPNINNQNRINNNYLNQIKLMNNKNENNLNYLANNFAIKETSNKNEEKEKIENNNRDNYINNDNLPSTNLNNNNKIKTFNNINENNLNNLVNNIFTKEGSNQNAEKEKIGNNNKDNNINNDNLPSANSNNNIAQINSLNDKNENNINLVNNTFTKEISTKNKVLEKIKYNKDNNINNNDPSKENLNNINDNDSDKKKLKDLKKANVLPLGIINKPDNNNNSKQTSTFNHKLNSSFDKTDINNSFDECIPKHKMSYSFIIKENPFFDKKYFSIDDEKKQKKERKEKKENDKKKEKKESISDVIDKLFESF